MKIRDRNDISTLVRCAEFRFVDWDQEMLHSENIHACRYRANHSRLLLGYLEHGISGKRSTLFDYDQFSLELDIHSALRNGIIIISTTRACKIYIARSLRNSTPSQYFSTIYTNTSI